MLVFQTLVSTEGPVEKITMETTITIITPVEERISCVIAPKNSKGTPAMVSYSFCLKLSQVEAYCTSSFCNKGFLCIRDVTNRLTNSDFIFYL